MDVAVTLLLATAVHLRAYQRSPDELGRMLGSPIPAGWPQFPEAIPNTLALLDRPGVPPGWSMHFFLGPRGRLVGSGGYAYAPRDRTTEIGYEIAPEYRGQGLGTAAARALVDQAARSGEVDAIVAHTLAATSPSTLVLARLRFEKVANVDDPDEGQLWRWRLEIRKPA